MREIGGYFELEQLAGRPYYAGLAALNSARSALLFILRARQAEKLWLPYFLCSSVEEMCRKEGFAVGFYHIGPDFLPIFREDALNAREYLYAVNYYGQVGPDKAAALQTRYGRLIFDNVQAFFQHPLPGMDTVYSCRKFFGVPDGGYAATDAPTSELPERDLSMGRMRHLLGRYEGAQAWDYYADFKASDRSFAGTGLRAMSALSENLLCAVDYETVRRRRNENYAVLKALLGEKNPLKLTAPDGAYAYPFYCRNGMAVKKRLAEKKIFVATLWPNVLENGDGLEKDYAENILPLPCDQRYGREDMERIAAELLCLI